MVDKKFLILFILVTLVFSIIAYKPADIVIAGPHMTDLEYFKDELQIIENSTGLKIKYEIYSDIETHLVDNQSTSIDIAIIPNPQGVINLGERSVVMPIDNIISLDTLNNFYSKHFGRNNGNGCSLVKNKPSKKGGLQACNKAT